MPEVVYDVFARKDRGDQLVHIGYIDALDDETARVYAWKTYDEEKWFEMVVVQVTHHLHGGLAALLVGLLQQTVKDVGRHPRELERYSRETTGLRQADRRSTFTIK